MYVRSLYNLQSSCLHSIFQPTPLKTEATNIEPTPYAYIHTCVLLKRLYMNTYIYISYVATVHMYYVYVHSVKRH